MPKSTPSQNIVPIKKIKNRVVVLNDGSLRAAIMTSSINFALKSEDERKATLYQFQDFLNALDFTLQIHIQSRELDIEPYLSTLEEQYEKQDNELLKIQIKEYVEFVRNFTENTNIMTKSFFVIVPYYSFFQTQRSNIISSLLGGSNEETPSEDENNSSFEQQQMQLEQRVGIVEQGLTRTGLKTHRLDDDELTELFHSIFNPGEGSSVKTE